MAAPGESFNECSKAILHQARTMLHPDDLPGVYLLAGEQPGVTFSLVRPFAGDDAKKAQLLHDDILSTLEGHDNLRNWTAAGVIQPEHAGATIFDGSTITAREPDLFERVSRVALALRMCAALPKSATERTTVYAAGVKASPLGRPRFVASLCMRGGVAYREFVAADDVATGATSGRQRSAQLLGRLAYIRKAPENTFVPVNGIKRAVSAVMPPDTPLLLDRVRLRVHAPGTSLYTELETQQQRTL